ncbi:MarR family winged helix-turn-helix transcriptional regulator [Patulibacter sp. NPDC049589]|uniref:MarR family winged helix-turn-helix transcriptional regulator n=1 Tax=Patulibacter sp. NPDC049589 TaxID=3154731 RepID=UPI00341A51AD
MRSIAMPGPEIVGEAGDSPVGRLEVGVSALVRWMGGRPIQDRVGASAGVDLPAASVGLLEHLEVAGPMRVSDIAACHQVDTSTATVRIQGLQRDGLVVRTPDPADRRVSMIAISVRGRDAVARLRAARRALLADLFAEVDAAEIEQVAALLRRVEQRMIDAAHGSAVPAPSP